MYSGRTKVIFCVNLRFNVIGNYRFICIGITNESVINLAYLYNSVCTRRHRFINSSASAPLNATEIAVMNVSDGGGYGQAGIIIFDL